MKVIKNTNIKISRFPQGNRRQRQYVHRKKKGKTIMYPPKFKSPSIHIQSVIKQKVKMYFINIANFTTLFSKNSGYKSLDINIANITVLKKKRETEKTFGILRHINKQLILSLDGSFSI